MRACVRVCVCFGLFKGSAHSRRCSPAAVNKQWVVESVMGRVCGWVGGSCSMGKPSRTYEQLRGGKEHTVRRVCGVV